MGGDLGGNQVTGPVRTPEGTPDAVNSGPPPRGGPHSPRSGWPKESTRTSSLSSVAAASCAQAVGQGHGEQWEWEVSGLRPGRRTRQSPLPPAARGSAQREAPTPNQPEDEEAVKNFSVGRRQRERAEEVEEPPDTFRPSGGGAGAGERGCRCVRRRRAWGVEVHLAIVEFKKGASCPSGNTLSRGRGPRRSWGWRATSVIRRGAGGDPPCPPFFCAFTLRRRRAARGSTAPWPSDCSRSAPPRFRYGRPGTTPQSSTRPRQRSSRTSPDP